MNLSSDHQAAFSARAEKAAARLAGVEREARRVVVGQPLQRVGVGPHLSQSPGGDLRSILISVEVEDRRPLAHDLEAHPQCQDRLVGAGEAGAIEWIP